VTILITGANGFIGRNLHEFLKTKENGVYHPEWINVGRTNNEHIDYQCDLTDFTQVKKMLAEIKPKRIIHLSGYSTSRPSPDDPSKIVRENIIATQNLLEAIIDPFTDFIFASSILVYGEKSRKEDEICEPTSIYGMTKLACEHLIRSSPKVHNHVSLRLCATIGEKHMTHGMLYDFFTKAKVEGPDFDVIGHRPGAIKPFIHVDEVCKAIWAVLTRDRFSGVYNLCPNDNISVEDVALRVLHKYDPWIKHIKWNPNQVWVGDNKYISFDNTKFSQEFFQTIPSSVDAVNKVIDNYEWSTQ
jgi:nucleoside-diphosphate-sugar epimerase